MRLATTHINTDLDGLASMVALQSLVGPLTLAVPGSLDSGAHRFYQAHAAELPRLVPLRQLRKRLDREPLDALYVVDTADPTRLGDLAEYIPRFAEVRAWDTHPPIEDALPLAPMPRVSACTSGLVLQLAEAGHRPTPTEAGLYLVAIHVDTGNFTFIGTTELDHQAASLCVGWGAPMEWPGRYAPRGYTRRQLALLEGMSHEVEFVDVGGQSAALLSLELERYEPDLSVLLEQLRDAEGWPAAFLLAGSGDRVFLIARSRGGLDAKAVVQRLGGGGHAEAASAVLRGLTLRDAQTLVRRTLTEELGRRRTAGDLAVRPFHSLPAKATIREAADALHRLRINALPLTRGQGSRRRIVGLVSRQEVDAAVRHGLGGRSVEDISRAEPVWVAPASPASEAARALISGPGRLVMVGTPPSEAIGILTRSTLFRTLAEDPPLAESKRPPPRETVIHLAKTGLGAQAFEVVSQLGALAAEMGLPAHLVGGTVRDILLKLPVRDIDLVVEGHAPKLAAEAARRLGGQVTTHEAFATARWTVRPGLSVDLASTRSEYYGAPGELPQVTRAGLRQDLYRRDFSINALTLSVDPRTLGQLWDPFGGLADLHQGVLRVLHGLSFLDDPTRAWRAARFAARLDFKVAPETLGLMRAALRSGAFDRLGPERLGWEVQLLLEEAEVEQAFRLLRQWRLLTQIDAKFAVTRGFFERMARVLAARHRLAGPTQQDIPPQADVLWIVLASAIPAERRPGRVRLVPGGQARRALFLEGPEHVTQALLRLGRCQRASQAARALEPLAEAERVVAMGWADSPASQEWIAWWEREGRTIKSAVDGRQLLALGFPEGRALGEALRAALDAARDGADPDEQRRIARALMEKRAAEGALGVRRSSG